MGGGKRINQAEGSILQGHNATPAKIASDEATLRDFRNMDKQRNLTSFLVHREAIAEALLDRSSTIGPIQSCDPDYLRLSTLAQRDRRVRRFPHEEGKKSCAASRVTENEDISDRPSTK